MNESIIGLVIFFGAIVFSRVVMSNALKKLDDESKLKLINAFSTGNTIPLIAVFSLVILYFGTIQFFPDKFFVTTVIYFLIFLIYLIIRLILNYRKLKRISVSQHYLKSFTLSQIVFFIGFICLFTTVFWTMNRS